MLIPQDHNDWLQTSSAGSAGTITQEMIDLVDNLIDASPRSRAEIYEKRKLKKKSQVSREEQMYLSSPEPIPKIDSSVGILKIDTGDVYEGQLLNGKRSGQGIMKFANGDTYDGMWK